MFNALQGQVTAGGVASVVLGSGFGEAASPVAVVVSGVPVTVLGHTDTSINILSPRGCGVGNSVTVVTPVCASVPTPVLHYHPPVVVTVSTPQGRGCGGGFPITLIGQVCAHGHGKALMCMYPAHTCCAHCV